ncbi:MAG: hypothetical protein R3C40_08660 [Parvularculaceae bacterium]
MFDQVFNDGNTSQNFRIDLDKKSISTGDAQGYSALCLIRKASVWGFFGHVYYLETKKIKGQKSYSLFGGGIELADRDEVKADPSPQAALAREFDEEIGPLPSLGNRKFSAADFHEFCSLLRNAEKGDKIAVDIYSLDDLTASAVHKKNIEDTRQSHIDRKKECMAGLATTTDKKEIEELNKKISYYSEIVAGKSVRIRRWLGMWWHLRWAFPLPIFPWRIRPNWSEFSPMAAYAIMTDNRIRSRAKQK